ncbi:hypothetical protein MKW92_049809, partial [Papaver armeniacum]
MDQDRSIFRTNITTDHRSLERRRNLRSTKVVRSSKKLTVLLMKNRKTSINSKAPKKKIKPQRGRGLHNQKREEEDTSDDEQHKLTRSAPRSSAAASGLKIKIKKKKRRIKNTVQSNKNNQIVINNNRQLVSVTSYGYTRKQQQKKLNGDSSELVVAPVNNLSSVDSSPMGEADDSTQHQSVVPQLQASISPITTITTTTPVVDQPHQPRQNQLQNSHPFEEDYNNLLKREAQLEQQQSENVDLVNIRREAEVKDPYWAPPPGWMPGDNPSKDPLCAKDVNFPKQKMSTLERNAEEIISTHKQLKMKMKLTKMKMRRRKSYHEGTFYMGFQVQGSFVVGSDTRVVSIEEKITLTSTNPETGEIEEEVSDKIDVIGNSIVAHGGTRRFNRKVKAMVKAK